MPWKKIRRSNVFGSDDVRLRDLVVVLHENKAANHIAHMHIAGKLVERRLRLNRTRTRQKDVRGQIGIGDGGIDGNIHPIIMSHFGHEAARGRKIFHILVAIDPAALCDIGICPIHKRHGIAEALVARRRIEHHAVELARIARNGAREAVARIVGRSVFTPQMPSYARQLIGGFAAQHCAPCHRRT